MILNLEAKMNLQQIKKDNEQRINLYALISRLMIIEIDEDFLKIIESDTAIMDMLPNFRDWSKKDEMTSEKLISEYINVDYTSLFLMHMVPYESFYVRDDQMIESGGDNPVIDLYNSFDFRVDISTARIVSADHIGVELEFMYMLSIALNKAIDEDDIDGVCEILAVQMGFMRDHILQWAPMFLINMKNESRTPIYHDGAELAMEFLLSDYEYMNKLNSDICGNKK